MKLPEELAGGLNRQITLELESSIAYLQMAAFFEERSLSGIAHWMRLQSEEEHAHALRFLDHLVDRGGHVVIGDVPAPRSSFSTPLEAFEAALEQERKVSAAIADLFSVASSAGDASSIPLIQWFLQEQVEEEAAVEQIIDRLRLIGDNGAALILLDQELGARPAETSSA